MRLHHQLLDFLLWDGELTSTNSGTSLNSSDMPPCFVGRWHAESVSVVTDGDDVQANDNDKEMWDGI